MKTAMVLWVSAGGEASFERAVPLQFIGRRNQQLGYSNEIDIVFIEGFEWLGTEYKNRLRDCGFNLRDASEIFRPHAQRFAMLDRFGGFLKNCFLRWLVLAELYGDEPVLHVDGDVVFNECPLVLQRLFADRTLVLQGCPALTAISDPAWYRQYEAGLIAFAADQAGYSARAWQERKGWEDSFHAKWAGHWIGPRIGSDQDLLSHLIHTNQLMQADPKEFSAAVPGYVFFENPLLIGELVAERPLRYQRIGLVDYLDGRRVGLWHMQTDWCRYLAKYMLREYLGLLPESGRISYGRNGAEDFVGGVVRKLTRQRVFSRPLIYERFLMKGDFTEVFVDRHWWSPAVFTRKSGEAG